MAKTLKPMMKYLLVALSWIFLGSMTFGQGITPIPNNDFEDWDSYPDYEDPVDWDTPNEELSAIPLFGTTVVTKSSEAQSGSFSARLESKDIFLAGEVPGFITCGTLTVDIATLSYEITGGQPVFDKPTHLKGYYKFIPQGGDSCAIGIGLFKTFVDTAVGNTTVEVGVGSFSTKDTVSDWEYFSAWIDYYTADQPDTMNIIALSSAQEDLTPGSVLYIDNLYLDYTVEVDPLDPGAGINVYHDLTSNRLLVFLDFDTEKEVVARLYDLRGQVVAQTIPQRLSQGKQILHYGPLCEGIYILEIMHAGMRYIEKHFIPN
jgi:hypothetical protein